MGASLHLNSVCAKSVSSAFCLATGSSNTARITGQQNQLMIQAIVYDGSSSDQSYDDVVEELSWRRQPGTPPPSHILTPTHHTAHTVTPR